jgi:hypothetical protein
MMYFLCSTYVKLYSQRFLSVLSGYLLVASLLSILTADSITSEKFLVLLLDFPDLYALDVSGGVTPKRSLPLWNPLFSGLKFKLFPLSSLVASGVGTAPIWECLPVLKLLMCWLNVTLLVSDGLKTGLLLI